MSPASAALTGGGDLLGIDQAERLQPRSGSGFGQCVTHRWTSLARRPHRGVRVDRPDRYPVGVPDDSLVVLLGTGATSRHDERARGEAGHSAAVQVQMQVPAGPRGPMAYPWEPSPTEVTVVSRNTESSRASTE